MDELTRAYSRHRAMPYKASLTDLLERLPRLAGAYSAEPAARMYAADPLSVFLEELTQAFAGDGPALAALAGALRRFREQTKGEAR